VRCKRSRSPDSGKRLAQFVRLHSWASAHLCT
jgi:hypothetical protein